MSKVKRMLNLVADLSDGETRLKKALQGMTKDNFSARTYMVECPR